MPASEENSMSQSIRTALIAFGITLALAGGTAGTPTLLAEAGPNGGAPQKQDRNGKEHHPVLQNAKRQLEAIKDRLQKAPTDFGGHREKAVDAITHAISELDQAIEFDKR
jgi:hypothetical protein